MATAVQDRTSQLDPVRRKRRSRATLAVVAGAVATLAVSGLSWAALRNDSSTVRSEPLPTTSTAAPSPPVTPAPTTAPPTPAAPERLTVDSRLSVNALGPVKVGMNLQEASAAAGVAIRLRPEESGGLDCTYARPERGIDGVAFMVEGGRIVRIDVVDTASGRVRTVSGIGRGSTEAEVMRTYGGQIRIEPHPYVAGGRNLVYVPGDAAFRPYRMIFEVIDGRVTAFRSGLADQASYPEGCS